MRLVGKMVLKRIFRSKTEEVTGSWRKNALGKYQQDYIVKKRDG
jgi:hypothetical protein